MRETIAKTDVKYDSNFIYYVKDGDVWGSARKKPGQPSKGKKQKMAATNVDLDYSKYMYFVGTDNSGNLIVERTQRQVGGSKRKKGGKSAPKKSKPAKKAAKKATGKKGGGKKGKRK